MAFVLANFRSLALFIPHFQDYDLVNVPVLLVQLETPEWLWLLIFILGDPVTSHRFSLLERKLLLNSVVNILEITLVQICAIVLLAHVL